MLKRPAASAAPVAPAETSASASPLATAFAARTIEDSGCARAAAAGLASLAIDSGASMTSMPGPALPISAAGPNSSTRTPWRDGEVGALGDLRGTEVGAVGVDRDDRHRARSVELLATP